MFCLCLSACINWPEGNDSAGLKAKAQVEEVIFAARAYRDKYGEYPKSLGVMVPEFIAEMPSKVAMQYNRSAGNIGFVYSPSTRWGGAARCMTNMDEIAWKCSDYKL